MLCCILGESGVGKDTVLRRLIFKSIEEKRSPEYKRFMLLTDRPKRYEEHDGEEYFFYSSRYLNYLKRRNTNVAEYREYKVNSGDIWSYVTRLNSLINALRSTDIYLVPCVPEQLTSYLNIANKENLYNRITAVVLTIDDDTRMNRALQRCTTPDEVSETMRRQSYDRSSMKFMTIPDDMKIENYDIDKCANDVDTYINKAFSENKNVYVECADIRKDYLDLYTAK